jgi:hypothetical protein
MSSLKLTDTLPTPDREEVFSAVADVAERSFFAMVDPCDEARFAELAEPHTEWLVATVRFEERTCAGAVSCRLPAALADRLFDAFSGRAPEELPPHPEEVRDLVGEFANMVCGSWLTRAANDRTFSLGKPVVGTKPVSGGNGESRTGLLVAIDDMPCQIDVRFYGVPQAATQG